jgi:hypothetical protein
MARRNQDESLKKTVKFPGLNGGEDFRAWRLRVQAWATIHGFIGVLDGTEVADEKNEHFHALLVLHVDARSLAEIARVSHELPKPDGRVSWRTVCKLHQPEDEMSRTTLLQRFYSLKMAPDEKMEAFLERFTLIIADLRLAGGDLDDANIVRHLYAILPASYQGFKIKYFDHPDQTLPTAVERLRLFWTNVLSPGEKAVFEAVAPAPALVAAGPRPRFAGQCWNCGVQGHIARNCRRPRFHGFTPGRTFSEHFANADSAVGPRSKNSKPVKPFE